MSYATASDLITRFSPDEIAQRAAPEGIRVSGELLVLTVQGGDRSAYGAEEIAAADAALLRVNEVLGDSSAIVDSYVSDRVKLPLNPVPRLLIQLDGDVWRYFIYDDDVPEDSIIERRYKQALKTLAMIRDGELSFGVQPEPTGNADVDMPQYVKPCAIFSRDTLKDF